MSNDFQKVLDTYLSPQKPKAQPKPKFTVSKLEREVIDALSKASQKAEADRAELSRSKTGRKIASTTPMSWRSLHDGALKAPGDLGNPTLEREMYNYDMSVFGVHTLGDPARVPKGMEGKWKARVEYRRKMLKALPERTSAQGKMNAQAKGPYTQADLAEATRGMTDPVLPRAIIGTSPAFQAWAAMTGGKTDNLKSMTDYALATSPTIGTDSDVDLALRAASVPFNDPIGYGRAATGDARTIAELPGWAQVTEAIGNVIPQLAASYATGGGTASSMVSKIGQIIANSALFDLPAYATMAKDSGGVGEAAENMALMIGRTFAPDATPAERTQGGIILAGLGLGAYGKMAGPRVPKAREPFFTPKADPTYAPDVPLDLVGMQKRRQRALPGRSPESIAESGLQGFEAQAQKALPAPGKPKALPRPAQKPKPAKFEPKADQNYQAGDVPDIRKGLKPVQTPAATQKEPWQMTRDEHYASVSRGQMKVNATWYKGLNDVAREYVWRSSHMDVSSVKAFINHAMKRFPKAVRYAAGMVEDADGSIYRFVPETKKWEQSSSITQFFNNVDRGVFHKQSVQKALSEGKPVPADVLADYPDLAQKPQSKPADGAQPAKVGTEEPKSYREQSVERARLLSHAKEIGMGKGQRRPVTPDEMRLHAQNLRDRADAMMQSKWNAIDDAPGSLLTGGSGSPAVRRAANKKNDKAWASFENAGQKAKELREAASKWDTRANNNDTTILKDRAGKAALREQARSREKAAESAKRKAAPIINDPSAMPITSAEWASTHRDYKLISVRDGVRVRYVMRDNALHEVYLTDKPAVTKSELANPQPKPLPSQGTGTAKPQSKSAEGAQSVRKKILINGKEVSVTPEIQAELDRHNARVKLGFLKPEDAKAEGMTHAANMRKLGNAPTYKEAAKAEAKAQMIRAGDRIIFEGRPGQVLSNPTFGKVKVRLDDGLETSVLYDKVQKVAIKPSQKPAQKEPWQMTREEYAYHVDAPKPTFESLSDSSAYQRSKMSERALNEMLKEKRSTRAKARIKYDAAVSEWEKHTKEAIASGRLTISDAFDTDAWDVLNDMLTSRGIEVASPFSIRKMSNADKSVYFERLSTDLRKRPVQLESPNTKKERWEITRKEYWKSDYAKSDPNKSKISDHKKAVRKALSEGKPVPAEVLADYPDLQPKPQSKPADGTQPAKAGMEEPRIVAERAVSGDARQSKIKEILDIADSYDPLATVRYVQRTETKGDNGQWYGVGGHPRSVTLTNETRSYWVKMSDEGTTYGTRFGSEAEAIAHTNDARARKRERFKSELDKMTAGRIQDQHEYWTGRRDAKDFAAKVVSEARSKEAVPKKSKVKPVKAPKQKPGELPYQTEARAKVEEIERNGGPKGRSGEILIERQRQRASARTDRFKIGDGVGWKPIKGQVNRGFSIIDIDHNEGMVKIKHVKDDGKLTVTGGNNERVADQWVPVEDVIRDKALDFNDNVRSRFQANANFDNDTRPRTKAEPVGQPAHTKAQAVQKIKDGLKKFTDIDPDGPHKTGAGWVPFTEGQIEGLKMVAEGAWELAKISGKSAMDHAFQTMKSHWNPTMQKWFEDEFKRRTTAKPERAANKPTEAVEAPTKKDAVPTPAKEAKAPPTNQKVPPAQASQAYADTLRKNLGLPDITKGKKTLASMVESPRAKEVDANAASFAREWLNDTKRPITDEETAGLARAMNRMDTDTKRIQNEHMAAIERGDTDGAARLDAQLSIVLDDLSDISRVVHRTGTEWGLAGVARRLQIQKDYSAGGLTYRLSKAVKRKASAAELKEAAGHAQSVADAEIQFNKKVEEAVAARLKGMRSAPRAKGNRIFTEDRYKAAVDRINRAARGEEVRMAAGLDPQAMSDLITIVGYHIESGIRTLPELLGKAKELGLDKADERDVALAANQVLSEMDANRKKVESKKATLATLRKEVKDIVDPSILEKVNAKIAEIDAEPMANHPKEYWQSRYNEVNGLLRELNRGKGIGEDVYARFEDAIQDPEVSKARIALQRRKADAEAWLNAKEWESQTGLRKAYELAVEAVNIPRVVLASGDLSAPGRQGLILLLANPKRSAAAFRDQFRAIKKAGAEKVLDGIMTEKRYDLARDAKLAIMDVTHSGLFPTEDQFISRFAGKLPVVAQSDRAYAAFLSRLRMDWFTQMVDAIEKSGQPVSLKEAKEIANFVNIATGRGNLGKFETHGNTLAKLMFSARYNWSRIQYLTGTPIWKSKSKRVQREILKAYGQTALGYAGLAAALTYGLGLSIGNDPTRGDIGRAIEGIRRYDITSGLSQYITLGARLFEGLVGNIRGDENQIKRGMSFDKGKRLVRGKLTPTLGIATDFGINQGKDMFTGKKMGFWDVARKLLLPIGVSQIIENKIEGKPLSDTAKESTAEFFGIGARTWDALPSSKKKAPPPKKLEPAYIPY